MNLTSDGPLMRRLACDTISPGLNPEYGWLAERNLSDPVFMLHVADRPEGSPGRLRAALTEQLAADSYDGFGWSQHGLPALRQRLESWIAASEDWPAGCGLRVSVGWTGTGPAMFDLMRLIADRSGTGAAVLVPEPGWSYRQRVLDSGLTPVSYPVSVASSAGPTVDSFAEVVHGCRTEGRPIGLILLNPQHNPTGANFAPELIRAIDRLAVDHNTFVLVDNAFFDLTATGVAPVSAVPLLARTAERGRLCHVRSLSKQFGCNSWSLGAVSASRVLLDEFADRWRGSREDPCGLRMQAAMATWLESADAAMYTAGRRAEIASNAALLRERLTAQGLTVIAHGGAPYGLLRLPPWTTDHLSFRHALFRRTGVIAGVAAQPGGPGWLKLFLGRDTGLFASATTAIANAAGLWRDRSECLAGSA